MATQGIRHHSDVYPTRGHAEETGCRSAPHIGLALLAPPTGLSGLTPPPDSGA